MPAPFSACWRASSHSCLKAPAGRAGSSLKGAGMYYPIAEEELQVVQDCMQQISLLVDLGSGISAVQTTVGTEALLSFLIAQREALQEIGRASCRERV